MDDKGCLKVTQEASLEALSHHYDDAAIRKKSPSVMVDTLNFNHLNTFRNG